MLSLAVAGVALCSFGLQVSAAPPKGANAQQAPGVDRQQFQRQRLSKPQASLEDQVAQLRAMVTELQQQVAQLRNDQSEDAHDAHQQFDQRLDSLEGVVQISPGSVKLVSNAKLEIRSPTHLELIAGGRVLITGADALVQAPLFTAEGVLRADSAVLNTVTAAVYTPGVGNIW